MSTSIWAFSALPVVDDIVRGFVQMFGGDIAGGADGQQEGEGEQAGEQELAADGQVLVHGVGKAAARGVRKRTPTLAAAGDEANDADARPPRRSSRSLPLRRLARQRSARNATA
jgi:hypothetical protein